MSKDSTPGRLERSLKIFADVRAGEGPTALLLLLVVFLVLASYYCVKPLREGWLAVTDIQGLSKIQIKAYSSFGQSIVLVAFAPLMAFLAGHLRRRTLLTGATVLFSLTLVFFWLVHPADGEPSSAALGVVFYLWVGIFGVTTVTLSWAFATDMYSVGRGERLLPLVAIGASAGAVGGSWFAESLLRYLDVWDLLIVSIVPLVAALALVYAIDRRGQTGVPLRPERRQEPAAPGGPGPFEMILKTRYLLLAAMLALIVNWVNTNGENVLFAYLQDVLGEQVRDLRLEDRAEVSRLLKLETTQFYSTLYFWVNLVALIMQAFFASRIVKLGGFVAILFFTPFIALISYGMMATFPALALIKLLKIAENSSNYSFNNTARQILWLPTPATMVYKAKMTIDTAFVRIGDGLAAVSVLAVSALVASPIPILVGLNVVLVGGWLVIARLLAKENQRLVNAPATAGVSP
ncbi:MAG: hypothetical protein DHS20C21_17900 [Gemmatimonadota bacterium]|nr:MAG: hypothetical protein DHS20C21_17900 [Gemmatimonadota bacterium]